MEERCILGNVQRWRLTEAVRSHIGDMYRGREWSRFTDVASFPCCGEFLLNKGRTRPENACT